MTWFKIDDTLWGHPKWIATGLAARGLWATAGSWSAAQLTDGFIPAHLLPMLGGRTRDAVELVARGLWETADGGWRFHDWSEYQPTRADVESKREYERDRKRKYRRSPDGTYSGTPKGTDKGSPTNPSRPVPYTPLPPAPNGAESQPNRSPAHAGSDFDTFWQTYPRKIDQPSARAAWAKATRDTPPELILAGLAINLPALTSSGAQFIPKPSTWLRNQRWTDDPPAAEQDPWAHLPRSIEAPPPGVPRPREEK